MAATWERKAEGGVRKLTCGYRTSNWAVSRLHQAPPLPPRRTWGLHHTDLVAARVVRVTLAVGHADVLHHPELFGTETLDNKAAEKATKAKGCLNSIQKPCRSPLRVESSARRKSGHRLSMRYNIKCANDALLRFWWVKRWRVQRT